MRYELSPFPPAIFEAGNIFRKAALTDCVCRLWFIKPQPAHTICDHASDAILDTVPETDHYVLDVLHRIPWKHGQSYGKIAQSYADFTIQHYGSATTIVFDGYRDAHLLKTTHIK